MKKLTLALLLIFSYATVWAADLSKGLAAYKAGDYATALAEWKPLAEQGDTQAQSNLGFMYFNGEGVIKDDKEAVKWYGLSAEQGDAEAQYNLGNMYFKGLGTFQSKYEAVKWYRLAAEQGYAKAQYHLGSAYLNGEGITQDKDYARLWFNIAAINGRMANEAVKGFLAKKMTSEDIFKAQDLARECVEKNYKDCEFVLDWDRRKPNVKDCVWAKKKWTKTKRLSLLTKVDPKYPRRALERGIEGKVTLQYDVSNKGHVVDPIVLEAKPPGIFNRAALNAILRYQYKPFVKSELPVKVEGVFCQVNFVI